MLWPPRPAVQEHSLSATDAVCRPNIIKYSGILTTPAKENLKKSLLLALWIYVSTFVGGSTISGFLDKLDLGSSSWYHELISILMKAALVAIPPTIAGYALIQTKRLER